MATAELANVGFKGWMQKYLELKKTPPKAGTIFHVKEGEKIRFQHDPAQDLLSCTLDIATERDQILNENGTFKDPEWRFVYESAKSKNGLRLIIEGPEKNLYLEWTEHVNVVGVKITRQSQTGNSVVGELILQS